MPSSSSEYTTAPSSPVKRRPGRPPKRKRSPVAVGNKSPTKLSVDEALKKYCTNKKLRIILTKCDANNQPDESSRPSSSLTVEPPRLEVNSVQFPIISPASSVASRPPVLVKEVNNSYPPEIHVEPRSVSLSSSQTVAQSTFPNPDRGHPEKIYFPQAMSPSLPPPCVQTDNHCSTVTNTTNGEVAYQNGVVEMDEIVQIDSNGAINPDPADIHHHQQRELNLNPPISESEFPSVFEDISSQPLLPEPKPARNVAAVLPRARKVYSQPEVSNRNKSQPLKFFSQEKMHNGHIITAAAGINEQSSEDYVIVNQAFTSPNLHCPPLSDMSHCNGVVESNNYGAENSENGSNCVRTELSLALPTAQHCFSQSSSLEHPQSVLNTAVAVPSHVLPPESVYQDDSSSDIVILPIVQNCVASEFDDPTTDEEDEDDDRVQILEIPQAMEFSGFEALMHSAETMLNDPPFIQSKIMWFSCVLFDTKVLHELTSHEQMSCQLFTTPTIGKLLSDSVLHNEAQSWPGVAQMDWRKPFIALDIITGNYSTCGPPGCRPCLRVQEKSAADTVSKDKSPRLWDLVIDKECENLVEEMIRLFRVDVKTTVIIWGARKQYYPVSWEEGVVGELLLMPTNKEEDVLSVLIFHHEDLSLERGRLIHGPFPDSELWHLQDPELGYRTLVQVEIRGEPSKPTHLTLHTLKPYIPPGGLPPKTAPCPLVLFPEDGESISDEEEQQLIDDEYLSGVEDQLDDGADEEEWDDFVSVSRAASRAASRAGSISRSPVANRYRNDLIECAERLFQKPKEFPSPPKVGQNSGHGELGEGANNHISTGAGSAISPLNGNATGAIIEERDQIHQNGNGGLHDITEEEIDEINYYDDGNGLPVISDSQKQMFLTQEFIMSDSELQEDQQQQGNAQEEDNLGETVLTPGNQLVENTFRSKNQPSSQLISGNNSKSSIVLPLWSKCTKKQGGKYNKQCNGDNSSSRISANAGDISKRKVNGVGSGPAPQQQEEQISFSENSAYYSFSDAIDEL